MVFMRSVVKVFTSRDGTRKVEIFQRADKTFGFEELRYGAEEKSWFPHGRYSYAIIDSIEAAIQEAKSRVSWLSIESGA